jgi:hypothetical protein
MPSAFERFSVQALIEHAEALGVEVPDEVLNICLGPSTSAGGLLWVLANPGREDERTGCCPAETEHGPSYCTCWVPVYDVEQAPPAEDGPVGPRDGMCGDCAFRPGSPERAEGYNRDALFRLADEGRPFYCHQGMRRPVRHRHPDGREVPGDPDDWQPLMVRGQPFQADGTPGMLCAGWTARFRQQHPAVTS